MIGQRYEFANSVVWEENSHFFLIDHDAGVDVHEIDSGTFYALRDMYLQHREYIDAAVAERLRQEASHEEPADG